MVLTNTLEGDVVTSYAIPSTIPTILDTGTAAIRLPMAYFNDLISYFNAEPDSTGQVWQVSCSLASQDGGLWFGFGGTSSAPAKLIGVPFQQLIWPTETSGVCALAILPDDSNLFNLGDPFLRAAYLVYDYDAATISLAQANFDDSCTDCVIAF